MQKMQSGNLKETYLKEIRENLKDSLGKKNIYEVPMMKKIVINTSFGKISPEGKMTEMILNKLSQITGQRPVLTKAKKAIAGFKIREGQEIGAKVTLRGKKMYHFFEKLVSVVLPRRRDFRGVNESSFDGTGNFTFGFSEINLFPEVEYSRSDKPIGLEITIATSASTNDEAKALLSKLGMPFSKSQEAQSPQVKKPVKLSN